MTDKPKVNTQPAPVAGKKSRQRSPNYPAIGLEKALERAQAVKDQAGRHFMPISVAFTAWNYKTAVGDQFVAALKAFGLVEVQGVKDKRQIRLTESAWRILGNAPDREGLLREAAIKPDIHKVIWEKYEGELPSDAILRNYLVWEKSFNEAFVDGFIAQFRATIAYANVTSSDNLAGEHSEERESEEQPPMQTQSTERSPQRESTTAPAARPLTDFRQMTELAFKLSRTSDAKIIIYGDATQEAIIKLQALLKLSEDAFPSGETASEQESKPES